MGFSSENRIFRGRTTVLIIINGLDSSNLYKRRFVKLFELLEMIPSMLK